MLVVEIFAFYIISRFIGSSSKNKNNLTYNKDKMKVGKMNLLEEMPPERNVGLNRNRMGNEGQDLLEILVTN
jgi:hypothetical protein